MSCLICVVEPERMADPRVQMVIEALGLGLLPHTCVVGSLGEAVEGARRYHARARGE